MVEVVETKGIDKNTELDMESLINMKMWGLISRFFSLIEKGFADFFKTEVAADPLMSEFLIPTYIGRLMEKKEIAVKVLKSMIPGMA